MVGEISGLQEQETHGLDRAQPPLLIVLLVSSWSFDPQNSSCFDPQLEIDESPITLP